MEPIDRRMLLGAAGIAGVAAMTKLAGAGPLNPPPGPVSPTGRTLDEIYGRIARTDVGVAEPRIPVQSLPGSATALHVISEPGSYYLTGNIQGVAGKNGIEVNADDVTLDLCGFALLGGAPGSLAGVLVGAVRGFEVSGGAIVGWAHSGVDATVAIASRIRHLRIAGIGAGGGAAIDLGPSGLVARCALASNNPTGIHIRTGCVVRDTEVRSGANAGIVSIGDDVLVERCAVRQHNGVGIYLFQSGMVRECRSEHNQIGITCEQRGQIINNVCTYCSLGVGTLFLDCVVDGNLAFRCGTGFSIGGVNNHVARNLARASTVEHFNIAPGNSHGPIVNVAGVGDISSVPGANHPWANFIY